MRKKHEEHFNHERWVVSYADFITLLFAFFVVLYAISEVDKKKMKKLSQSVQFAFHFKGSGGTEKPGVFDKGGIYPETISKNLPSWAGASPELVRFFSEELPDAYRHAGGGDLKVTIEGDAITLQFGAASVFDPGWDKPRREAVPFLEKVARGARAAGSRIEVQLEVPQPRAVADYQVAYARLASLDYYFSSIYGVPPERYQSRVVKKDPKTLGSLDEVYASPEEFTKLAVTMTQP